MIREIGHELLVTVMALIVIAVGVKYKKIKVIPMKKMVMEIKKK